MLAFALITARVFLRVFASRLVIREKPDNKGTERQKQQVPVSNKRVCSYLRAPTNKNITQGQAGLLTIILTVWHAPFQFVILKFLSHFDFKVDLASLFKRSSLNFDFKVPFKLQCQRFF